MPCLCPPVPPGPVPVTCRVPRVTEVLSHWSPVTCQVPCVIRSSCHDTGVLSLCYACVPLSPGPIPGTYGVSCATESCPSDMSGPLCHRVLSPLPCLCPLMPPVSCPSDILGPLCHQVLSPCHACVPLCHQHSVPMTFGVPCAARSCSPVPPGPVLMPYWGPPVPPGLCHHDRLESPVLLESCPHVMPVSPCAIGVLCL